METPNEHQAQNWSLHRLLRRYFVRHPVYTHSRPNLANNTNRAVVSAAGRSYTAFTMDYVGDVLYDVANTNMWILGESTCLIVVFCIPTIPKLFGEIKRRGSSAASMTTLTAASSRPGAINSRHEEFWGRLDDRPDGRAHINDNYGGVDGASQVRLADVEAARPSTSTGQGYGDRSDGGEFGYQNQPWPNKALLR
jgi:hypothetical protein